MIRSKILSGTSSKVCSWVELVLKLPDDFKFVFPLRAMLALRHPFQSGFFSSFAFSSKIERCECEESKQTLFIQSCILKHTKGIKKS